jgi:hypothetical protein
VVDVEELGDARERRLALAVLHVVPGVEGHVLRVWPRHDGARFVFAVDCYRLVEAAAGGVGGDCCGPNKLV